MLMLDFIVGLAIGAAAVFGLAVVGLILFVAAWMARGSH